MHAVNLVTLRQLEDDLPTTPSTQHRNIKILNLHSVWVPMQYMSASNKFKTFKLLHIKYSKQNPIEHLRWSFFAKIVNV